MSIVFISFVMNFSVIPFFLLIDFKLSFYAIT